MFAAKVADNVTAALVPIAAYSNGNSLYDPNFGARKSGGQDRHRAARRHRQQQGRLDGRLYAAAVHRGVGGGTDKAPRC